jgi:hypothetical protein
VELRTKLCKSGQPARWTKERIGALTRHEVESLRANAATLGEEDVVARCDAALHEMPKGGGTAAGRVDKFVRARRLISRAKALEARGVWLKDARSSWSGVRKSDGVVVMTLWAAAVESAHGGCSYLLWAPNVDGSRPWSDGPAGRERLEHCRLALKCGSAEGLLVFGEPLEGYLPEDKARSVHGVDPDTILHFRVEQRGDEYWAAWGKKLA